MPLHIVEQDITTLEVDAVVNTTNEEMVGYSGVDLAIHTQGGRELDEACRQRAPLGFGEVAVTRGYNLPCRYVIHVIGPLWQGGGEGEDILLRACYRSALKAAADRGCETVAFPLISAGAQGFPKESVLRLASGAIAEFLREQEMTVFLCILDKDSYVIDPRVQRDLSALKNGRPLVKRSAYGGPALFAEEFCDTKACLPVLALCGMAKAAPAPKRSLQDYVGNLDEGFAEMLFRLIDEGGMTDVECYKKANVDKRTFSKIKSGKGYRPSKTTVVAFAIALKLDLEKTQALLATVGFTLSNSQLFDKIIRYFIEAENYDVFAINEALFEFDQVLLGAV